MALPSGKKRKIFDGRYEVIAIVGRGTDSVVYHARHAGSPTQEVALKVLLNHGDRASVTDRLRKEALTLVSCRHKYVVRLDDFHSLGELCYLSMEYASEGDLRKYTTKLGRPLSSESGERFLRQCLEALDFVHATGVIHRDLKPDNILVLNEREIRLADFGLALLPGDEPSLDDLRTGVGSFSYLPPEVLEGVRYDTRSDLYALGLCFYETLSGTHPFENLPLAMQMEGRQDGTLKPLHELNPSIPRKLSAIIQKLMRFDASDRYQTAAEALKALNNPQSIETSESPARATGPVVAEPSGIKTVEEEKAPQEVAANEDIPFSSTSDSTPFAPRETSEPDSSSAPADYEGERIPQPTEKIDLERIKEIIAKDAKQKAEAASRRAARERAAAQAAQKVQAAHQGRPRPAAPPPVVSASKKGGKDKARRGTKGFGSIPSSLRPALGVALGAAVLTVVGATIAAYLLPSSSNPRDDIPPVGSETVAALPEASNNEEKVPQSGGETQGFPALTAGMYSGVIEGVIPGATSPFTLISLAKQDMLAVIVGIEGWTPVLVSTAVEPDSPPGTIVARSNGIILNITGSGSSDTIEGTFFNAVTGEAGSWRVKKVS